MIPLGVVNQGRQVTQILIDGNGVDTTIIGGVYLDQEYYKVRNKWPSRGETVIFTITENITIYARWPDHHALNTGDNWNNTNQIIVNNRSKCYGHGGNGGSGAFIYRYGTNATDVFRLAAEAGGDGYAAISNTTEASMVVDNYGIICGGGGGGGGGAAWDYTEPGSRWGSRRNGTTAGGGAPNGMKSEPVGTPLWYFKLSNPDNYEEIKNKYDSVMFSKPKPSLGLRNSSRAFGSTVDGLYYWHANGVIYKGKPNLIDINSNTPVNFTLSNSFLNKYGVFELPEMMNHDTLVDSYNRIYPALVANNYAKSPATRRYAAKGLLKQQMASGTIDFPSGVGPYVLMSSDADLLSEGWGGSTMGVGKLRNPFDASLIFHGLAWYGTGSPYNSLVDGFPLAWDDNFGGDGGVPGEPGKDGYYKHLFMTQAGTFQLSKRGVKRLPKTYLDEIKDTIDFEPPAKGGQPGFISIGDVTVNNRGKGVTLGRVPGLSGEVTSQVEFEFYHLESDARKVGSVGYTHQVTRLGPVSASGEPLRYYTNYRTDAVLECLRIDLNDRTWPAEHYSRAPYASWNKTLDYYFEVGLPDGFDVRTHSLTVSTNSNATYSVVADKLIITVPANVNLIGDGQTGYFVVVLNHRLTMKITRL